jgi:hypothetical protein
MEASGQVHAPVALLSGKELPGAIAGRDVPPSSLCSKSQALFLIVCHLTTLLVTGLCRILDESAVAVRGTRLAFVWRDWGKPQNLSQDSWRLGRDSNHAPAEHECKEVWMATADRSGPSCCTNAVVSTNWTNVIIRFGPCSMWAKGHKWGLRRANSSTPQTNRAQFLYLDDTWIAWERGSNFRT